MDEQRGAGFAERLEAVPAWKFLAAIALVIAGIAALSLALPGIVYRGFVEPYLWKPLVRDEGFNPANTALMVLLIALLVGWAYALSRRFHVPVDDRTALASIVYMVWGPVLRVLEDADLFAPYDVGLGGANAACGPEGAGGWLDRCFGIAFVTPVNFVWVVLAMIGFGRLAVRVVDLVRIHGAGRALVFHGLVLAAGLALYLAWWTASPSYVRFLPHPGLVLAACLAAFGLVAGWWRVTRRMPWSLVWFSYGLVPTLVSLAYVATWLLGGAPGWMPTRPVRAWVLLGVVAYPMLIAAAALLAARAIRGPGRRTSRPRGLAGLYAYLLLLVAFTALGSLVALAGLTDEGPDAGRVLWLFAAPAMVGVAYLAARRAAQGSYGTHPAFAAFLPASSLLLVAAQSADALMTSLGLDVFGAQEKHVVPRFLIAALDRLGLPAPLGSYPAALVMIPYKLLLALALVAAVEIWNRPVFATRRNLAVLLLLAATAVGLVPALRDALRLAMGV